MIQLKECKELLKRYARLKHMEDLEKLNLFTLLNTKCQAVFGFVTWLDEHYSSRFETPRPILSLLIALSCNSPVCAIIHPDDQLETLLDDVIREKTTPSNDPQKMQVLQTKCPILFNALVALESDQLPDSWCTLIQSMRNIAFSPFSADVLDQEPPSPTFDPMPDDNCNQLTNFYFFPNITIKRQRISFPADHENEKICTKFYRGHPSLLPGIFTIFCPHGKL